MKKTMRSGEGWRMRAGWSRLTASASGAGRLAVGLAACPTLVAGLSGPALAHTAERSFVPTLPTGLYIAGGAIVVAVSFLLVALVPAADLRLVERAVWRVGQAPEHLPTIVSLISFSATIALVLAHERDDIELLQHGRLCETAGDFRKTYCREDSR